MNDTVIPVFGKRIYLPTTLIAMAALLCAEETPPPALPELPTYQVTGSHFNYEAETPDLPGATIDADALELWSDFSPVDALRKETFSFGNSNTDNDSNGGTGSAGANLHGLGNLSTLTLINGRRAGGNSAFGFQHGGFANLNLIPSAAIREIQVVTDGTSVAYGSDAVAGTVNLLLHDTFTGNRIDAGYSNTTDGDASEKTFSFLTGQDLSETTHLVLLGSWYQRNAIYARDRDISDDTDRSDQGGQDQGSPTFPGIIQTTGGITMIRVDLDDPSLGYRPWDPSAPSEPIGLYNYNEFAPSIPALERRSLMANLTQELTDTIEAWGEILYTETEFDNQLAPAPWSAADNAFEHPDLFAAIVGTPGTPSPHFPDSISQDELTQVRYRSFELGNLKATQGQDALRGLVGLRGHINEWDWESAALYIRTNLETQWSGIADASILAEKVADGSFNPFAGAFASGSTTQADDSVVFYDNETALKAAATTATERFEETFRNFDINAGGPIFDLPAGEARLLLGAEYREEGIAVKIDDLFVHGGNLGGPSNSPYSADRQVSSIFAESILPILGSPTNSEEPSLDLNLALRLENYSDKSGGESNSYDALVYKAGLSYKPIPQLTIRASYGTSFRAPTLSESFGAPQAAYYIYHDPYGPTPEFARIPTVIQGNPDLDPEQSRNINFGVVFESEPDRGWRLSIDYYRIQTKDGIVNSAQDLINRGAGGVIRDGSGNLAVVFANWFNAAEITTDGIDYELSHKQPFSGGYWQASLGLNQALSYDVIAVEGDPSVSYLGRIVDPRASNENIAGPGSIPRYKGYARFTWTREQLTLAATLNYIHSLHDNALYTTNHEPRKVDSWSSLDLAAQYAWPADADSWFGGSTVRLGIENVTDEAPPFAAGAFADGYDSSLYSLAGRRLNISLSHEF